MADPSISGVTVVQIANYTGNKRNLYSIAKGFSIRYFSKIRGYLFVFS